MTAYDIFCMIRDRLRKMVTDPGEQKLLDELHRLREREEALYAAAGAGEKVTEKLEEARAQAVDLSGRLPRGANLMFCVLGVLCVLAVGGLAGLYDRIHPVVVGMWGGQEAWAGNWYLQEFRPGRVRFYQFGRLLMSSVWFYVALASLVVVLWFVQRKLRHWQARSIMLILICLGVLAFFSLLLAPFHLLVGPMMQAL